MDKKIVKLLDGTSTLSNHSGSEDWAYWKFNKDEIDKNEELRYFLDINKHIIVETLFKKEYQEIKPYVDYNVPLVKIKENEYLVHDSTRIVLLYFCLHLLKEDIEKLIENINTSEALNIEGSIKDERFSYPIEHELNVEESLFFGLNYPLATKRLMRRIPHILWYKNGLKFIGLKPLERAENYAESSFNFSKLKI